MNQTYTCLRYDRKIKFRMISGQHFINEAPGHSRFTDNRSIQVYLYSAFNDTNRCKAALKKMLSFYIIFRSRLLVVTTAEMHSKNHADSYKLHIIIAVKSV